MRHLFHPYFSLIHKTTLRHMLVRAHTHMRTLITYIHACYCIFVQDTHAQHKQTHTHTTHRQIQLHRCSCARTRILERA